MIIIEHGPKMQPICFDRPNALFVATSRDEVIPALQAAEAARKAGAWIAGYVSYEAGYTFESRLGQVDTHPDTAPRVLLAAYHAPEAMPQDTRFDAAKIAPLKPLISRDDYARAYARVMDYIRAGDCYQVNLTFPLASHVVQGSPSDVYHSLRAGGGVGYGAFVDLGIGPAIVSRSPELFFTITPDGMIESRPMKGTAPRSDDPVEDMMFAASLRASDKIRAENLMIVDLLRNDLSRMSEVGSVQVPELFYVESFSTVHQMSSRVRGRLRGGSDLLSVMRALAPCGSVTGAPKIRAMEIIRAVEPHPRGVYCGAIGWVAPDGAQCWNVAIRTLRIDQNGQILLNVGGGIVADSTPDGEWEEALWKTRFMDVITPRA